MSVTGFGYTLNTPFSKLSVPKTPVTNKTSSMLYKLLASIEKKSMPPTTPSTLNNCGAKSTLFILIVQVGGTAFMSK